MKMTKKVDFLSFWYACTNSLKLRIDPNPKVLCKEGCTYLCGSKVVDKKVSRAPLDRDRECEQTAVVVVICRLAFLTIAEAPTDAGKVWYQKNLSTGGRHYLLFFVSSREKRVLFLSNEGQTFTDFDLETLPNQNIRC